MAYGINRIPQDRDGDTENIAELEAQEMNRPRQTAKCDNCGRLVAKAQLMASHLGSVCAECFDID